MDPDGPKKAYIRGVQIPVRRAMFKGKDVPGYARQQNYAKTAEPIKTPFVLWARVG